MAFIFAVFVALAVSLSHRAEAQVGNVISNRLAGLTTAWERTAAVQGTTTWKTASLDPERYEGYEVWLSQDDFKHGTIRLIRPGVYKLRENIIFNPNPDTDWLPACSDRSKTSHQAQYCSGGGPSKPYRLGFFAAITIEGSKIVLDLNGKTLRQAEEHALQQRFFSLVELASQPFISPPNGDAQGPAPGGFGDAIASASGATVKNGVLGRSAHHGIHGNLVEDVYVESVILEGYEVSAIHINGANNLGVVRTEARAHFRNIPVRASYSAGRFLLQSVVPLLESYGISQAAREDISSKVTKLRDAMNSAKTEILSGGSIRTPELQRQFGLETTHDGLRVVDGNAYGMTFSSGGFIVNEFKCNLETGTKFGELVNVHLSDVTIKGVVNNVFEIPGLSGQNGEGRQTDSAGAVLRMNEILNDDEQTYKPDPLHDLRFAVAWWASDGHGNDAYLVGAKKSKRLGTFSISGEVARWARERLRISDVMSANGYVWMCNEDSMAHRQKGAIGLFLHSGRKLYVDNVRIDRVRNYGGPGTDKCGNYVNAPKTENANMKGYTGMLSRGFLLASVHNVRASDVTITRTESRNGDARGLEVILGSRNIDLEDVSIRDTKAINAWKGPLPNRPAVAEGFAASGYTKNLKTMNLNVEGTGESRYC